MRIQLLTALALCVGMTGCSRIKEAAMPVPDKINAAHPVSSDVRLARESLQAMLADDAKSLDNVNAQADLRMTMRALSCSKSLTIGRLDSVATVKGLPLATPCFQEQDRELLKFYGIHAVGVLLSKPALRPMKPVGPLAVLPKGKLSYLVNGAVARDAGVGVLLDGGGEGFTVEIPGGTPIAQLPRVGSLGGNGAQLSPNGRVLVFHPSGQGPVFVEAETGNRIWSAEGNGSSHLLAWLPEVSSFVMTGPEGDAMLADGLKGTLEPHPLSIKNSAFAAHIPGTPARLLMGTARELILVEHTRSEQGLKATQIKQYTLKAGPGITSGNPVPMRSGHLVVYASSRDIGWLDLDSGVSGTWRSSPFFGIPFAKLDENHIMVDSVESGRMSLKPWSFDITNETVAPIDLGASPGMIVNIGDRIGFLRRSNEVSFGDVVTVGPTRTLDSVVADFELQQQIAKLQMLTDQEARMETTSERSSAAAIDDLVRGGRTMPGLNDVPADAEVHMVGVYEGKRDAGPSNGHPIRNVRIVARGTGRPIVLAFSSYESVNWVVANQGARISAVLLSGYSPSTVTGLGNVPVLRIGSAYAYAAGSPEYVQLRKAVTQYTGAREIRSFQGSYTGSEFSVGGR